MKLSKELRCLVCQNETLADSQADLAADLRDQIREQMRAGKSDKEIVDYLTQRYGKFILYNPPVDPTTYLLWFGPFVLLLAGLFVLFRYVKQRRELIVEAAAFRRRTTASRNAAYKPTRQTKPHDTFLAHFRRVDCDRPGVYPADTIAAWSKRRPADAKQRANVEVYRDQLSELESDVANGLVSTEQYQQDRDEIERRLLEDIAAGRAD